jgi:hypothetical protein
VLLRWGHGGDEAEVDGEGARAARRAGVRHGFARRARVGAPSQTTTGFGPLYDERRGVCNKAPRGRHRASVVISGSGKRGTKVKPKLYVVNVTAQKKFSGNFVDMLKVLYVSLYACGAPYTLLMYFTCYT